MKQAAPNLAALAALAITLSAWLAPGQPAAAEAIKAAPVPCGLALVNNQLLRRAAFEALKLAAGKMRIIFLGHSTFQIETSGGARAATDFNGFNVLAGRLPQIVTMNNRHDTHYTDYVDPAVKFVLRGGDPAGGATTTPASLSATVTMDMPLRDQYAMDAPSGDHAGLPVDRSLSDMSVISRPSGVAVNTRWSFTTPILERVNAMWPPSGDHVGK